MYYAYTAVNNLMTEVVILMFFDGAKVRRVSELCKKNCHCVR